MARTKAIPFRRWWNTIQSKDREQQIKIIEDWLYYACKTIANRGDQNQQKVVYTIATRYNKSKYKKISKENARKVYILVNNKQMAHRKLSARIKELEESLEAARSANRVPRKDPQITGKNVVITRKKHRKIITGGRQQ